MALWGQAEAEAEAEVVVVGKKIASTRLTFVTSGVGEAGEEEALEAVGAPLAKAGKGVALASGCS